MSGTLNSSQSNNISFNCIAYYFGDLTQLIGKKEPSVNL